ncbi:MAG: LpxI family protein [Nitrospirae bacterium]|nr:MAG: LpxI family protein [Nitrospirota bacterium]
MDKTLGIIAGNGDLPILIAKEALNKGYYVVVFALEPVSEVPDDAGHEVIRLNVGKLGGLLKALKTAGVSEVVMAGKVTKELIYNGGGKITPDLKALGLLMSLKDRKDDTIMRAVTDEIESLGIKIRNTTDFADSLLMPEGVLTKRKPSRSELKDIEFGYRMAKEIGRLDIGQTVVVKDLAVMAVEAIEGTDETIRRGGRLAREGAVVVKVSKPDQDFRFDVPVVGLNTVRSLAEVSGSVLGVEAKKALILQKEELIEFANKRGISIVGI